MRMRAAAAASAATVALAHIAGWGVIASRLAAHGGGEYGKFFFETGRTAMRTRCPFPVGGSNKNLALFLALVAVKFVDRHG